MLNTSLGRKVNIRDTGQTTILRILICP